MKEIENKDIGYQLAMMLVLVIICFLLGQGLAFVILKMAGISIEQAAELESTSDRQTFRLANILSHLIAFTLSSWIFLKLFHRDSIASFLKTRRLPTVQMLITCVALIFFIYPLVIYVTQWSMSWPLPEWAKASSEATQDLLKGVLNMESPSELIVTLILVGIVPAIGEELLFRGVIQNKLKKIISNPHIAIIIASLLFGMMHFQLERFLALSVLGLVLGYSYHYTRNFWVPVILHFINNSFQVLNLYGNKEMIEEIDLNEIPELPIAAVIISVVVCLALLQVLRNTYLKTAEETNEQELTT